MGVLVVALMSIGWLTSRCSMPGDSGARSSPSREPPKAPAATTTVELGAQVGRARRQLAALRVVDRSPPAASSYRRAAFGDSWQDVDGNGCNQRDDVLRRDAVPGTIRVGVQGTCDHDVLAGTWLDPYTGRRLVFTDLKDLRQAEAIQIDHVVPLAEAWRSGASAWSRQRRERFAGDLAELLAVDGPANMSKGDDDPAAWRPRKGFQCAYALRWVATKSRWALGADASEKVALGQMLDRCR